MHKIWSYLTRHLQEDFDATQYFLTLALLSVSIYLNYRFDFEDSYLDTRPELQRMAFYFLTHCAAYYLPVALYAFIQKKQVFHSPGFWVRSLLALFLLSLYRSLPYFDNLIGELAGPATLFFVYKIGKNMAGVALLIMPLLIFYWKADRTQKHRYGLNSRQFDFSPYFIMLLLMVPLISAASFLPDFQNQYPRYETTTAHTYLGVGEWVTAGFYELTYGINFVSIEFFYRGFLVIGMAGVLGRGSVLSMAVLYCVLHFGKPMGEAISSIFGGFILGAIAYQTRSIWGGVIVHVGIAWMMEFAAYLQNLLRQS